MKSLFRRLRSRTRVTSGPRPPRAAWPGLVALGLLLAGVVGAQPPPQREPLVSPPLLFVSSQVKYGLYQNYLHRYMDRPLLMDRATRGPGVLTEASFHRIMGHVQQYGLDGLSIIVGTPGMVDRYERALNAAATAGQPEFQIMPRWGTGQDIAYLDRALKAALASPHSTRIKGRVLGGAYGTDAFTPAQLAEMLAKLRALHGDQFIYCTHLGRSWNQAMDERRTSGAVTEATTRKMQDTIAAYLDVSDGIYVYPNMFRTRDRQLDVEFYRDYVIPTLHSVLTREPYRQKYLGVAGVIGYYNFMSGSHLDEQGTRTLRQSYETALQARADFIDMPEWDELNEHTCIEPTITNSFSTQRLIRYYTNRARGQAPQPNPGDDLTVPNLVVSYRKVLTLGEALQVELLNIPDGAFGQNYRVEFSLLDTAGQTVHAFPAAQLAADQLSEVRLDYPTQRLAGQLLLRPQVVITMADGRQQRFQDGLQHVTLRPTDNWDYKWVKFPLRDLLRPTRADFTVTAPAAGQPACRVQGRLACPEPLAFVEVLENDNEVYGVDVSQEYPDREKYMLVDISLRALREHRPFTGRISVENAPVTIHTATDGRYYFNRGDALEVNFWLNVWPRGGFISIPREKVGEAVLVLDFNLYQRRIPLSRLAKLGVYSETLDEGMTITLEDYRRLPDITPHVGRPEAEFDFTLKPRRPHSVVWLRAIAQSGRIYHSAPVLLGALPPAGPVTLDVFSDPEDRPVQVTVDGASVPDLRYEFNPAHGSLLVTPAGRPFWGHLGGREIDATGVGGGESGGMGDTFRSGAAYPAEAKNTAPRYVEEEGRSCLEFDGLGNFITLPREVTPRRGSWTLEFEIKPASPKKQVLFAHHAHYIGSVVVYLENGEIWSQYSDRYLSTPRQNYGLKLPLNQWSTVRLSYNLATMTCTVNGQTAPPQPSPGPGMYVGASVFGGLGEGTEFFQGRLRALRMVHRAL
jgi:hypothetical protein